MKVRITDVLQITAAILMTGSMAFAMQPTAEATPPAAQVIDNPKVEIVNKIDKPKGRSEVRVKVTWRDNPMGCDEKKQYIRKDNFKCIDKPAPTVSAAQPAAPSASISGAFHYDCRPQKAAVKAAVDRQGLSKDWFYIDYIFSHESCHDPGRLNPTGCAGLGQACPGSKLPCGANDVDCQVRYFHGYAMGRYKSWSAAYAFWNRTDARPYPGHWW